MKTEKIEIATEYIRLDQLLKFTGIADTGGQAKEIVASGVCVIDGEPCLLRGKKLRPGDAVSIEDVRIEVVGPCR